MQEVFQDKTNTLLTQADHDRGIIRIRSYWVAKSSGEAVVSVS